MDHSNVMPVLCVAGTAVLMLVAMVQKRPPSNGAASAASWSAGRAGMPGESGVILARTFGGCRKP